MKLLDSSLPMNNGQKKFPETKRARPGFDPGPVAFKARIIPQDQRVICKQRAILSSNLCKALVNTELVIEWISSNKIKQNIQYSSFVLPSFQETCNEQSSCLHPIQCDGRIRRIPGTGIS